MQPLIQPPPQQPPPPPPPPSSSGIVVRAHESYSYTSGGLPARRGGLLSPEPRAGHPHYDGPVMSDRQLLAPVSKSGMCSLVESEPSACADGVCCHCPVDLRLYALRAGPGGVSMR